MGEVQSVGAGRCATECSSWVVEALHTNPPAVVLSPRHVDCLGSAFRVPRHLHLGIAVPRVPSSAKPSSPPAVKVAQAPAKALTICPRSNLASGLQDSGLWTRAIVIGYVVVPCSTVQCWVMHTLHASAVVSCTYSGGDSAGGDGEGASGVRGCHYR